MFKNLNKRDLILYAAASAVLLAQLFPLPAPVNMTGHPWRIELLSAIALIVLFLYMMAKTGGLPLPRELSIPVFLLAAFVAFASVSAIWAQSAWSVFHHTYLWLCYLLVFVVVSSLLSKNDGLARVAGFLAFLGILLGSMLILGYLQLIFNPTYEPVFRVTYSKYSEILATLTPFFFVAAAVAKGKTASLYTLAAIVSFLAVVLSLSRTSFVAVIAGILVSTALVVYFGRTKRSLVRAAVLIASFAGIFAVAQFVAPVTGSENSLYSRFKSDSAYQVSSSDIRYLLLGISGEMIRDNPVTGVGADNFGLELNRYRATYSKSNSNNRRLLAGQELMLERAHNEYLQIAAELGIPMLLLILAFFGYCAVLFLRKIRVVGVPNEFAFRAGAAGGSIAFLVSSLASSFSFRALQNGIVFFILLVLATGSFGSENSENHGSSSRIAASAGLLLCFVALIVFGSQAASGFLVANGDRTEDAGAALKTYETAGKLDSQNAAVDMSIAIRKFNDKRPKEAAPYFRKAIDKGGGVIATYYYLAISQSLAGDNDSALVTARECASIYPVSPFSRVFLAHFLRLSGNEKEAASEQDAAREIGEKEAYTWDAIFRSGALETSVAARKKNNLVPLQDLSPNSVVLSVIGKEKIYK